MTANNRQRHRAAGVLLVLAWVLWFHYWAPALLVVTFVVWAILHKRLEAGLGDVLLRQWRRVWPPGPLVLIALLLASTLAFVLQDAPAKAKILPVGLDVLALSMILHRLIRPQEGRRDREAEARGGREVDHELELGGLVHLKRP